MLRDAWFIAVNDLKFMLRQRETLLWTFLIPPIIFYFVGTITTNGFIGGGAQRIAVQIDAESGFLGEQIISRLEEQNFEVARFNSEELIIDPNGELASVQNPPAFRDHLLRLHIPAGFTASVLSGEQVRLLLDNDGESLNNDLNTFRLNRAVYTVLADVLASSGLTTNASADLTELTAGDIAELRERERSLGLEVSAAGRRIPTGFEQSVPGVTVMFTLLVLLTSGTTALVIERRAGILKRLASAPIGRGAVVLGKWGGKYALAIIQVGFALLIGRFVLGVDYGPEIPMLLLTLGSYTALIASIGIFVGNIATTEGQAVAIGVLSANVLAALGGCFWPIEITPDYMQQLSLFLPTGWMMDAMHKLMIFGREWSAALPHFIGMSAAAWVIGIMCARQFRFE